MIGGRARARPPFSIRRTQALETKHDFSNRLGNDENVRRVAALLASLVIFLVTGCASQRLPTVSVLAAGGQCTPQTLVLRANVKHRISLLNQDAGGANWDLYLNVPSQERANLPDTQPSLVLSAKTQQTAAGVLTPRKTGQFEYTCVTETRSLIVRPGVVNVIE
jgi:hypothetical protein